MLRMVGFTEDEGELLGALLRETVHELYDDSPEEDCWPMMWDMASRIDPHETGLESPPWSA